MQTGELEAFWLRGKLWRTTRSKSPPTSGRYSPGRERSG
jgi:hypothetical protein